MTPRSSEDSDAHSKQRLCPSLATLCLFLVLTSIIIGMQVHARFQPGLPAALIVLVALFAVRVNKTLIRFGWV